MKTSASRPALPILFVLILFLWGTKGNFSIVLTAFWPRYHGIVFSFFIMFLLLFFCCESRITSLYKAVVKIRYILMPLLGFVASSLVVFFVFQAIPHVIDAAHFVWMTHLLEQGRLSLPADSLYEYYRNTFNVLHNGRYFSLFLPGFSVALIPFDLLGILPFSGPIFFAALIFVSGKSAEKVSHSASVSFLTMLMMLCSSFYLFTSASFMTHIFNALLTVSAFYFIIAFHEKKYLLISGFLLASLLLIRPQNALFSYIPFAGTVLVTRDRKLLSLSLFTAPFLLFGAGLALYNIHFTGHPLLFPQDIYFLIREPRPFCHRLGIGKGCPNTEGIYLPDAGLTWKYAFWVTSARLSQLLFNVTTHPFVLFFVPLGLWWRTRQLLFPALLFLSYLVGYFFFYLSGNLFGPRYFTEVLPFLLLIAAYGISLFSVTLGKFGKSLAAAGIVGTILFWGTTIMPPLVKGYSVSFGRADRSIEHFLDKKNITDSIVFIPPYYGATFLNLADNPPEDHHGNLILLSRGQEDYYAATWYMEKKGYRAAYKLDYYPDSNRTVTMEELFEPSPDEVLIELEDKGLPLSGKPDYVVRFLTSKPGKKRFFPIKQLDDTVSLSNGAVLAVNFRHISDTSYYDFSFPIIAPGAYLLHFRYITTPCGGNYSFTVNGKTVRTFNTLSKQQTAQSFTVTVPLKGGDNYFSFIPHTDNSCLILDFIHLKKMYAEPRRQSVTNTIETTP